MGDSTCFAILGDLVEGHFSKIDFLQEKSDEINSKVETHSEGRFLLGVFDML